MGLKINTGIPTARSTGFTLTREHALTVDALTPLRATVKARAAVRRIGVEIVTKVGTLLDRGEITRESDSHHRLVAESLGVFAVLAPAVTAVECLETVRVIVARSAPTAGGGDSVTFSPLAVGTRGTDISAESAVGSVGGQVGAVSEARTDGRTIVGRSGV